MAQRVRSRPRCSSRDPFPVAHGLATGDPSSARRSFGWARRSARLRDRRASRTSSSGATASGKVIDELASRRRSRDPENLSRRPPRRVRRGSIAKHGHLGRRSRSAIGARRLTFDPAMDRYPIWSPDGATITFASGDGPALRSLSQGFGRYRRPERLTSEPSAQHAMDWSADGKHLRSPGTSRAPT